MKFSDFFNSFFRENIFFISIYCYVLAFFGNINLRVLNKLLIVLPSLFDIFKIQYFKRYHSEFFKLRDPTTQGLLFC